MKMALTLLLVLSASYAGAAEEANEHRDGPCIKIMEACKSAGFGKGGASKSLSKDCMQPILSGQKVTGINLDANDIAACKAKKSELKK